MKTEPGASPNRRNLLSAYACGVPLTVHLPEDLSRRVTEVAEARHVSPEQVAIEVIGSHLPASDPLEAFIGSGDSGDPSWAGRDTHELRTEAAERRDAG